MIVDLPNTTTAAVSKKLVALRANTGAMALSRVLTLVVVVDETEAEEAIEVANDASRQHPCRIIVVVGGNRRGQARLDGQIRLGGDARQLAGHVRKGGHFADVALPGLHQPVLDAGLADVVEDEGHLGTLADVFNDVAELMMVDANVEGEVEFR